MTNPISEKERQSYENFQQTAFKCAIANVVFAGFLREMRWLPACMMAPVFALTTEIASDAAEKVFDYFIPEEFKDDILTFIQENPSYSLIYNVSFIALSIIGSAILTQGALLSVARTASFHACLKLAALDLIPYYLFDLIGTSNQEA